MNKFARLYYDGFKEMPKWARILWIIILIKLILFFGVLRPFFFKRTLNVECNSNEQQVEYILKNITRPAQ